MKWQGRFIFCFILGFIIVFNETGFSRENFTRKVLEKEASSSAVLKPKKRSKELYNSLAINYVVLNTLDLATTFYSLDHGAKEANPIARTFIKNRPLAILIKGGITGGVLVTLAKLKKRDKKAAYITLGILNLVYGFVLKNNVNVILRLNK